MHTPDKNIAKEVRSELNSVMTTAKTTVREGVLTAIESFVIHRVELAVKLVNAYCGRSVDGDVLDPGQKEFQKTAKAFK